MERSFFSHASRVLQDQFDSRRIADRIAHLRRQSYFDDWSLEVITQAPMFFIATADKDGRPDCSVKAGDAGFVSVVDTNCLIFPDYDGNGMFRSLGNISENQYVGMLFLEFSGERRKLRINGMASIINSNNLLHRYVGAKQLVKVKALDIFPNCPRYLPKLLIDEPSVYVPKEGYQPPDPAWKSKPDLLDYLPIKE